MSTSSLIYLLGEAVIITALIVTLVALRQRNDTT
jgi:hypothetical protein